MRYIVTGFTIVCLLIAASALRAQDDCKTMLKVLTDSSAKLHTTPAHVYTTTTIDGQTFNSEIIYAAGNMYMKINGKWSLAGSIKDMEQLEQQKPKDANPGHTCRSLKDEQLNGETASVYSSHAETAKGKIDVRVWISKAKGLPLREDTNSDQGKTVISARYEYGAIKPPL